MRPDTLSHNLIFIAMSGDKTDAWKKKKRKRREGRQDRMKNVCVCEREKRRKTKDL